jgi:hypothetical protein
MPLPPALAARLAKRGILKVSYVLFPILRKFLLVVMLSIRILASYSTGIQFKEKINIFILEKLPDLHYISSLIFIKNRQALGEAFRPPEKTSRF